MTFMQYSIQHKNYTPMFDLVPRCQVSRCPPLLYTHRFIDLAAWWLDWTTWDL